MEGENKNKSSNWFCVCCDIAVYQHVVTWVCLLRHTETFARTTCFVIGGLITILRKYWKFYISLEINQGNV